MPGASGDPGDFKIDQLKESDSQYTADTDAASFSQCALVPEPCTGVLLLIGLAPLVGRGRRRQFNIAA